jgi:hypothetical protein
MIPYPDLSATPASLLLTTMGRPSRPRREMFERRS